MNNDSKIVKKVNTNLTPDYVSSVRNKLLDKISKQSFSAFLENKIQKSPQEDIEFLSLLLNKYKTIEPDAKDKLVSKEFLIHELSQTELNNNSNNNSNNTSNNSSNNSSVTSKTSSVISEDEDLEISERSNNI
jgi:hypothetical protein